MALSPWINFPVAFPEDGAHVWCRMNRWARQPFRAIWQASDEWKGFAIVADADWNETPPRCPWWALDAWKPE